MKIAIGCDHAAFDEKNNLITYLENKNFLVKILAVLAMIQLIIRIMQG